MADFRGEIKGKSRLAVFEHVVEKEKRVSKRKRKYSDDSSQSESELVISDLPVPKTKTGVNLKDEVLNLHCGWDPCSQNFKNFNEFLNHIVEHSEEILDSYDCKWQNCPNPEINSLSTLARHLSYHGYLKKLQNIGDNVAKRQNLPDCNFKNISKIEVSDFMCQWDNCDLWFGSITDFLCHIAEHVHWAPSKSDKCDIPCEWSGCGTKVLTRYKLGEHVRVHTKERFLGCSKCGATFVTKTTFSEHRKRQLKSNLRRYQCSQCLKLFPTERILSDHMRSHINQYKCSMCDMTSAKPSELAKHYRYRHINDRPFKCHSCDKSFVAKCNLRTHLQTHRLDPFKCTLCDEGYKSKVGLNSHMDKCHSKELKPKYQCHVCKMYLSRGDTLTKHLMKKHKFHWPSGHSRFRYRKDQDGVCRLQTVRYESLEVTEEMIKSERIQKQNKTNTALTYHITHDSALKDGFKVTVMEEGGGKDVENVIDITSPEKNDPSSFEKNQPPVSEATSNPEVLIMIEDVDEQGKVINSHVLKSALVVRSVKKQQSEEKSRTTSSKDSVELVDESCQSMEDSVVKQDDTPLTKLLKNANKNALLNDSTNVKIKQETPDDDETEGDSTSSSNISHGSVIAMCDNNSIQVLKPISKFDNDSAQVFKPIEFVDVKIEKP